MWSLSPWKSKRGVVNYFGFNLVIGDKNPENPNIPPNGLL